MEGNALKRKDITFIFLLVLIFIVYIATQPRFIIFTRILTKGAAANE